MGFGKDDRNAHAVCILACSVSIFVRFSERDALPAEEQFSCQHQVQQCTESARLALSRWEKGLSRQIVPQKQIDFCYREKAIVQGHSR
jgi:hypothetical protein